jgi:type IV pilus assembly protein PilW
MTRERGFSMVSLMVGMFISMTVVLAVYGSSAFLETNRRHMIAGNAAFDNAMAALLAMQRSARQAGLAIVTDGRLACPSLNVFRNGAVRADGALIAPLRITDGGDDSDTLTVAFAESLQAAMPIQTTMPMAPAATSLLTANAIGIAAGDLVLIGTPGTGAPCTLLQVSAVEVSAAPPGMLVRHQGVTGWNPADRAATFTTMPSYPTGALVQRMGNWNWLSYRVVDGRLEEVDNTTGATNVLSDDIVFLKVAYGTTAGPNRTIEQWTGPAGAWSDPTAAQFDQVRAVRIGVVARSSQRIKPTVAGGGCDATPEALLALWPDGPVVDLSRTRDDWACFAYRPFTLVVPLRNVIFGA